MSPRKTILRELNQRRTDGSGGYTRPGTIDGFSSRPSHYQTAVNALLQERLINGTRDAEGRMAIAINEDRLVDVQRELRPVWARPVAWMVAFMAVTLTGVVWMML